MKNLVRIFTFLAFLFCATGAVAQGQLQPGQLWGNPTGSQALPEGALPSAYGVATLSAIETWTGAQSFTDTKLILLGSGSGSVVLRAPATGGVQATFFPGTDTVAGLAATQTLTNKTFNCANNTCTVRLASDVIGNLPLANLAVGTSDTVIGYFGATSGSATALPNCSNALIYSTSTHLFTCNTLAGTGTVTNIATGGLATGGPITSTGTITVSPAAQSDQQAASSNALAVTPAQQQSHPSALKAFGLWQANGCSGSCALSKEYNISSVTRSGAGQYTINFTTSFASNSSYACVISTQITSTFSTSGVVGYVPAAGQGASTLQINVVLYTGASFADPETVYVMCAGGQ